MLYFVSYHYDHNAKSISGYGSEEIIIDREIESINDIKEMREIVRDRKFGSNWDYSITIINFIKLK
jgi:hypothetical protein